MITWSDMPGMYAPCGGGVAEDDGDGGDPGGGQARDVAEDAAARDEDLFLGRQVGATGLDEADAGQPVGERDLVGAQGLLQGPRVTGSATHRRIVRGDQALDALDYPDPRDEGGTDGVVAAPGREGEFEEGGIGVEKQLDTFAGEQLAAFAVPLDVLLTTARERLGVLGVERVELAEHGLAVSGEVGTADVQGRGENGHKRTSGMSR